MEFSSILLRSKVITKIVLIILNFICSFLKRINTLSSNKNGKVVIISLHKLGDSILTTYAIKEIENYYRDDISLICFNETYDVFNLVFERINLIKLSKSDFYFEQRIASSRARRVIKNLQPEVIIDLTGSITSASLIFNSRAKRMVGINSPFFRKLYSDFIPIRTQPHLIDIYLDVARTIVPISDNFTAPISEQYSSKGYIVIHPFAGWAAKEWGLRKFIELAEILSHRIECVIVFPSEKMKTDIINELESRKIRYTETKSMSDLIEITKHCSLFIGNDSGPLHLANLFGKPTFSIYGPTNPEYHLPVTGNNGFFAKQINCSPQKGEKLCFTNGGRNGCPSFECMKNITVKEVENNFQKFLNDNFLLNNLFK